LAKNDDKLLFIDLPAQLGRRFLCGTVVRLKSTSLAESSTLNMDD
jgi:hypothetical protein